jgi:hypothetical protein
MLDSFISVIKATRVKGKFWQRRQLERPGANRSAACHRNKDCQKGGTPDGHKGGNKHPAITGEPDRSSKETTNDCARDSHGQIHPHTESFSFQAFAGKPSGGESNENPDCNLHVFSSAENHRRENQERLGACPLRKNQRVSAKDGLIR